MKLIVHRGTEEIGGSCVEVSTDRARILLDAGLPLPSLDEGAPAVSALPASLGPVEGEHPLLDAVFLSHVHADHSGLIPERPDGTPVCLSRISSKLLLAGQVFAGGMASGGSAWPSERSVTLRDWRPVRYEDLLVTPVPVDHSVPGAFAFLVESRTHRILYSGDLRWHGARIHLIDEMVERLRERPLDALIMEGTTLGTGGRDPISEDDLPNLITNRLRSSGRLGLAMYSPQNVDRLLTMIRVAELTHRTLVLDPYALFVLHLMKSEAGMPDPFAGDLPIRVWFPNGREPRGTGPFKKVPDEVSALEIDKGEILTHPQRHMLTFRPWMASRHPEILQQSDVAIWSYWPGYERTARIAALRGRLDSAGIEWFRAHASGHILPGDLQRLVEQLNPKTLIPIHTGHADRFMEFFPGRSVSRLRDGEIFKP